MITPTSLAGNAATSDLMLNTGKETKAPDPQQAKDREEFRNVFHQFVGTTIFGQMLKSMRQTQQKPAYFDGGRAEEIFQQQLDQKLVDKITEATSKTMSDPMFKLMTARRG